MRVKISKIDPLCPPPPRYPYWSEFSKSIQNLAVARNFRATYDSIEKAVRRPLNSSTGEVTTDKGKQMGRWVEHYINLHSHQNVLSSSALDAVKCMPTLGDLDAKPTKDELNKAIDSLTQIEAPGSDEIPLDLIKCQ